MSQPKAKKSIRRRVVNIRLLVISFISLLLVVPACLAWHRHRAAQTGHALLEQATRFEKQEKWTKATVYLQRYLSLEPEDTEALVRLAHVYSQREPSPKRIYRLNKLLYQTLGRVPERDDLRLMLAENLLKGGDFQAAEQEAKKLVDAGGAETDQAEKTLVLSRYYQVGQEGGISLVESAEELNEAVEDLPSDVLLVEITANLLRKLKQESKLGISSPVERADKLMNRLIEMNSEDADAFVARHKYRLRYGLEKTAEDLDTALELDPNHVEALILASRRALNGDKDMMQAENFVRRALEADPAGGQIYLELANVLQQNGNADGAIEVLREGQQSAKNVKIEIDIALAKSLLEAKKTEEAERVIGSLNRKSAVTLARLNADAKILLENQLRLLRARLALAQNRFQPAYALLRAVLAAERSQQAGIWSAEARQATALLAQHLKAQARWDLAKPYWDRLAKALPDQALVILSAADCANKTRQFEQSITYLEQFLPVARANSNPLLPDVHVLLAQSHLFNQLSRPEAERNWVEFRNVIRQAKAEAPLRWEIPVVALNYFLMKFQEATRASNLDDRETQQAAAESESEIRADVLKGLNYLETKFTEVPEVWRQVAIAYQKLGDAKEVERATDKYRTLEKSPVKVAALQAELQTLRQDYQAAEKTLNAAIAKAQGTEKLQLELKLVDILLKAEKPTDAKSLIGRVIEENPSNPQFIIAGIELCLDSGDMQTAEKWEGLLSENTLYDFERQYLQSRRLLARYEELSDRQRQSLQPLLEELRAMKPRWYPVIALSARLYELRDDQKQAIDLYQLAVDFGDRRPVTLERLVTLLSAQGRLEEAQLYIGRLTAEQPGNSQFELAEISLAVQQDRLGEAVNLARKALDKDPDNPMKYVVLASMLSRNGQPEKAISILRQATENFPTEQSVWNALFTMLVEANQLEQARTTLEQLIEALDLAAGKRAFVLAQAYQKLGDLAEAKAQYQKAIRQEPASVAARLGYAKMLLAADIASAREQFEAVLSIDASNDVARRALAQLLVETGREEDAARAISLLQVNEDKEVRGTKPLDNRLQAYLLTKMGKTRNERLKNCQKAEQILLQEVNAKEVPNRNAALILLARVYEQQAELSGNDAVLESSRDQYRQLVDRSNPSSYHLSFYLEFLLRHAKPNSPYATQFLNNANLRFAELKKAQSREGVEVAPLANLRTEIRLMQLGGQLEEAAETLKRFAEQHESEIVADITGKKESGQLYAAVGSLYSSLENYDQAEIWFRKLVELYPEMYAALANCLAKQGRLEDAVEVCLRVYGDSPSTRPVIVIEQLLTNSDRTLPNQSRLETLIESTLNAHPKDINLLLATAVWHVGQQNNEQAIELFRRVVEINPEHTLALNNLATLLAEQPDQLDQALQYIQQAIDIAGRRQALLDTQGTIYLKMKDSEKAIACLEEATVSGASDPRYFFHLAAAYELANLEESAQEAWQRARDYGLAEALLTADDRKLLASLQDKFEPTRGKVR